MAKRAPATDFPALRFRTAEILERGLPVTIALDHDKLRELIADGDDSYHTVGSGLNGQLELTASGDNVFVRGGFEVTLGHTCRRCLAKGQRTYAIEMDWTFLPAEKYRLEVPEEEEVELTEDDLDVSFFEGETIDLKEVIREAILLEIEPYPACEPACPPEAETSTRDETDGVDPRWLPLMNLKKKGRA